MRGSTTVQSQTSAGGSHGIRRWALLWLAPLSSPPTLKALDSFPHLVGRDPGCFAPDGASGVSRQHAEIRKDGPIVVVRDLGSTNGTHLNGERIGEAPLERGSIVRFGDAVACVVDAAEDQRFAEIGTGLFAGPVLAQALALALKAAPSTLPIVIQGETGTGKERVANAIHEQSVRRGALVAINCAALPEGLAEAELFGYRRGAFTGADRPSQGLLRASHGGTLLLDEISDLPLGVQAKLLRALEEGAVVPLGEATPVPVDSRLLAAAQEPLELAVEQGRFRADLHARLNGLTVELPALRDRRVEIPWLFYRLACIHAGGRPPPVEGRLVESLCLYDWPGNVRELDLLVRRLLVLHGGEPMLRRSQLPERLRGTATPPAAALPQAVDLEQLLSALRKQRGNVARAAASLGISRQKAYRLMEGGATNVDLGSLRAGPPRS